MRSYLSVFSLMLIIFLAGCTSGEESALDQTEETPDVSEESSANQNTNDLNELEVLVVDDSTLEQNELLPETHSEIFETMFEYMMLVANNNKNEPYKTSEPTQVIMIEDITLEGTGGGNVELWTFADGESEAPSIMQNFYIKSVSVQPGVTEGIINWFGPFQGELGNLIEQANQDPRLALYYDEGEEGQELFLPGTHSDVFDALYDYQSLIRDSNANQPYETSEPSDVIIIRDITLNDVDFTRTELWGNEDWVSEGPEAMQNFYIKSAGGSLDGDELIETITWFGPFKGQLGALIEHAKTDERLSSSD